MLHIDINLALLDSTIAQLKTKGNQYAVEHSRYSGRAAQLLADAKGYEKEECLNIIRALLRMMNSMNALYGSTVNSLQAARDAYLNADTSLGDQY